MAWNAENAAEATASENKWRRTFCQVPLQSINAHADAGKRSVQQLLAFFRRKVEIERRQSEDLRKCLKTAGLEELEVSDSSVFDALQETRSYCDAVCMQQLRLARLLEDQVVEPLEALHSASQEYIRTLRGMIKDADKEYKRAETTYNQAKTRVYNAADNVLDAKARQIQALQDIGIPSFELQRLATRIEKSEEAQMQAEMDKQQSKTELYKSIVARDEMAMAVSFAYQKAEEERLDQLNTCLQQFVQIEKERAKVTDRLVSSLQQPIASLSRPDDIQLFVEKYRDPENLHFQGKALALMDWHWRQMSSSEHKQHQEEVHSSHIDTGMEKVEETTSAQVNNVELNFIETDLKGLFRATSTSNTEPKEDEDSDVNGEAQSSESQTTTQVASDTDISGRVQTVCEQGQGRAFFVQCLNRQRSMETRIDSQVSFDTLVHCFHHFLDACVQHEDLKAAKTAMILAETFYLPKLIPDTSGGQEEDSEQSTMKSSSGQKEVKVYLQEELRKHSIWKKPTFWEKALLLAVGEELQKMPQPYAWEDLPQTYSDQDGIPSRQEAVARIHNIVFGQIASFSLSMLEFDVPQAQIESFVEGMCDAYELTEHQRHALRRNLHEIN